jgi:hypothetical protein
MPVVAKRQRLGQVAGQRLEAAEMRRPLFVSKLQPDPLGRAAVEEARLAFGKSRRLDRVVELGPERQDLRVGPLRNHCASSGLRAGRFQG